MVVREIDAIRASREDRFPRLAVSRRYPPRRKHRQAKRRMSTKQREHPLEFERAGASLTGLGLTDPRMRSADKVIVVNQG